MTVYPPSVPRTLLARFHSFSELAPDLVEEGLQYIDGAVDESLSDPCEDQHDISSILVKIFKVFVGSL